MHLDVHDMRDFYYRSALGRAAQRIVRDQVLQFWPDAHGHTMVGYGFAVPLLRPYLKGARRVVGLMPAPQGVMSWPAGQPNVTVLCEETLWPLETGHVDRLIMMHGLETSERPSELLDECYRVLGPGGEALFVVPNRSGLWARSEKTPFGYGRPYSLSQLDAQLKRHDFIRPPYSVLGRCRDVSSVGLDRVGSAIGVRSSGDVLAHSKLDLEKKYLGHLEHLLGPPP